MKRKYTLFVELEVELYKDAEPSKPLDILPELWADAGWRGCPEGNIVHTELIGARYEGEEP